MRLVDSHCHLDLYPDHGAVLTESERAGIYTIAVTNAPSVFRRSAMLTRNARFVRTALGLHPELAREREHELILLDTLLDETRYVGEIGLDYVTDDMDDQEAQRRVFSTFLDRCASHGNKVLTIHSRRAADDVVAMVGRSFPGAVILHWFSGSLGVLKSAVAQGCYFSVNTAMVASTSGMRLIREMPQERVLTETDGPFIMVSDRPARPADIETVVSGLASLWSLDPDEAAASIFGNFQRALIDREAAERVASRPS
ncbi:MAG: Qat anti-phage system TatD family nuclease QatD [Thermomicrobiales bacterium]